MNSKTLFFNKTIFKTDLQRNWWISALLTIAIFLGSSLPLYNQFTYLEPLVETREANFIIQRITNVFENVSYVSYVFGIGAAIFASAILFSYLTKSGSVSCIHGLPITRKQLYFTHIFSGAVLLVCPVLINSLFWLRALSFGLAPIKILQVIFIYLIYTIISFALTTLLGTVMGNTSSQVIFSVCVALFPLLVAGFLEIAAGATLYGYDSQGKIFVSLTEYVYLLPKNLLTLSSLIYVVLSLAIFVAGYLFYRARHLENHGEIVAFNGLKGVFKVVFASCCGMLGYFYSLSMWDISNLLIMLPFAFVGLVISHMLANKSLSLKGILPSLCSIIVIVFAMFSACEFDLIRFETRVPDVDDVEYACFTNDYVQTNYWTDGEKYDYAHVYYPHFTDKKEIQMFLDFHEYIIDDRSAGDGRAIVLMYKLKNGKEIYRRYRGVSDKIMERYINPIYETDTYKMYQYPYFDTTEKNLKYISVGGSAMRDSKRIMANTQQADELISAMRKDMENRTYRQSENRQMHGSLMNIRIVYSKPINYEGTNVRVSNWKTFTEIDETYTVTMYDTNTLQVLENMGFLEEFKEYILKNAKTATINAYFEIYDVDLQYAETSSYKIGSGLYTMTEPYEYKYSDFYAQFDDKEQIENIYDFAFENAGYVADRNSVNIRLEIRFIYTDGTDNIHDYAQIRVPYEIVPDFIKQKLDISK